MTTMPRLMQKLLRGGATIIPGAMSIPEPRLWQTFKIRIITESAYF